MTDIKTFYRANFKAVCDTVKKKRPESAKMITSISDDSIIRVNKEYSIHLLRKTRVSSYLLHHIRLIDNKTDECIMQGQIIIPVQRISKK